MADIHSLNRRLSFGVLRLKHLELQGCGEKGVGYGNQNGREKFDHDDKGMDTSALQKMFTTHSLHMELKHRRELDSIVKVYKKGASAIHKKHSKQG